MDETVSWIEHATQAVNAFLSDPSPLRAVVFGFLLSLIATQALKFSPDLLKLSPDKHRAWVRCLSFCVGAGVVLVLWPADMWARSFAALITGAGAPTAYTMLVRILYHYFPWLEPRISAKPGARPSE